MKNDLQMILIKTMGQITEMINFTVVCMIYVHHVVVAIVNVRH